jgi:hypothetical protein
VGRGGGGLYGLGLIGSLCGSTYFSIEGARNRCMVRVMQGKSGER